MIIVYIPKKMIDAKDLLCSVLETVTLVGGKFKAEVIADILTGKENIETDAYRFSELETFDSVSEEEEELVMPVIRQAVLSGLLSKKVESYGTLKITKKGKDFLKAPTKFMVAADEDFSDDDDGENITREAGGGSASVLDSMLFSILKDLRKKAAKKHNLPPFAIFQDPSLEAMCTTYPITLEELTNVPGVGVGKTKNFGQEFVDVIRQYVEDNDIMRPDDIRIKTVANKSKLKLEIIQAIDRRVALDDLAESKGIEFDSLLDEIDAIVFSGTKINISYFIEEVMDPEMIEEAMEYFREEAKSDDIDTAWEYLGENDYRREEIRMIRIKFLSEVGN